ncbi:MAG: nicotinate (nicotinamide) nucleotide adenylyltransferase, partial [Lachnospiraceae bacterium]|nr:nicotinate (nicotinamide) nucleotide adenylyltransferase [Lachnospiraceae bacterium]
SYLTQWKIVDKVWLMLSPLNPLKNPSELIPDLRRLDMLKLACTDVPDVQICDIELSMPRPSYTINTLRYLSKRYPSKRFNLVMGGDNWNLFDKWREHETILDDYGVIVYPRPGKELQNRFADGMEIVTPPQVDLSSTFIRAAIAKGRDMTCFLPAGVYSYIRKNNLYLPRTDIKQGK